MRRFLVVVASVAMLGAAKADPPASAPDANGWAVAERSGVCLLFSEAKLAFAAPDGQHVALLSPGALGGPKVFNLDSGPLEAQFTADGGVLIAPTSDEMLGKLLQSGRIRAAWPDAQIDTAPPAMQSLIDLRSCGAKIAAKKAADAAKAEKRRQFAEKLARAGAALRDSGGDDGGFSAPRAGGGVCFKRREWSSGFNRNCVYDCTGSEAVQTIGSAELCPLTINR